MGEGDPTTRVKVVVQSDGRRVDATMPADWPVASLVPDLLRLLYGPEEGDRAGKLSWALGYPDGQPFPGVSTLGDLGVMEGSLLHLEQTGGWAPAANGAEAGGSPSERHVSRENLRPRQRTRAILPRRLSTTQRLGLGLRAVFDRSAVASGVRPAQLAPGVTVSPRRLTVRRPMSLKDRVRMRWRASDYLNQLDAAIQGPQLRRCVTVAVMSPKGGVGKTTLTALLGSLFALLRRDRVVAIDNNPDFGSLGRTLTPEHEVFVDDLLEVLDSPELTVTALDANLGRGAHGMMVLPAPTDPVRMARLGEDAYLRVVRRLQDMVGIVILDCGTGFHEPAARAALRTADQVILVTDSEPATASLVAEAAALLTHDRIPIWLVVNKMPSARSGQLDLTALEGYIPQARGLVPVPAEAGAARSLSSGAFDWRDAPAGWKRAVREVAADLVSAWPDLEATLVGRSKPTPR
jgi:MinD-like ATPase involved in chromosome partitioning or flagellar assembly